MNVSRWSRCLVLAAAVVLAAGFFGHDSADASGLVAGLICEPDFNGAICEAVPNDEPIYYYYWSTSGSAVISNGPINGPIRVASCVGYGSGSVSVTVVRQDGSASGSASSSVC